MSNQSRRLLAAVPLVALVIAACSGEPLAPRSALGPADVPLAAIIGPPSPPGGVTLPPAALAAVATLRATLQGTNSPFAAYLLAQLDRLFPTSGPPNTASGAPVAGAQITADGGRGPASADKGGAGNNGNNGNNDNNNDVGDHQDGAATDALIGALKALEKDVDRAVRDRLLTKKQGEQIRALIAAIIKALEQN